MATVPDSVARFLNCTRVAVAGVSRQANQPANAIFRRLRDTGHEVFPVNPNAAAVEGVTCYRDLKAVPGPLEAVMVVTHPDAAPDVVRQAVDLGVRHVWFHRSFGAGSVSQEAVAECHARGIEPIVGGCPMMFSGNVDVAHACMRWWLQRSGRVPR